METKDILILLGVFIVGSLIVIALVNTSSSSVLNKIKNSLKTSSPESQILKFEIPCSEDMTDYFNRLQEKYIQGEGMADYKIKLNEMKTFNSTEELEAYLDKMFISIWEKSLIMEELEKNLPENKLYTIKFTESGTLPPTITPGGNIVEDYFISRRMIGICKGSGNSEFKLLGSVD